MKINEAIRLSAALRETTLLQPLRAFSEAVQLGIEALKRVRDMRISPCTTADEQLPGETDEANEARQLGMAERAE